MINTVYERLNNESGLILRDKEMITRQDKVVGFLIKKVGSNLIKGKSIMNISLPVSIFDKRSLHHVYKKFLDILYLKNNIEFKYLL